MSGVLADQGVHNGNVRVGESMLIKRLVFVMVLLVPSVALAQYDSLSEIRFAARMMTNEKGLHDSVFTYAANLAVKRVQADLRSEVDTQHVVMESLAIRYSLAANAIHGLVAGVIWKDGTGTEKALTPIDFASIGNVQQDKTYPAHYTVEGSWLIISAAPSNGDTLFVFYYPHANHMDGDTTATGLDDGEDVGVIYLTCAYVALSRLQLQTASLWFNEYALWKNSRLGVANAAQ